MPTFDTPGPLTASVDLPIGELRVVATDRTDTTVEVHSSTGDRAEAEAVRVELVGDELRVQGRRLGLRTLLVPTPGRSLEVEIALPTGSSLTARSGYGGVQVEGRVAGCRVETGYGDVRLEDAGPVDLTTNYGAVRVTGTVDGDATVVADHGEVRLGRITGDADLRTKHGTVRVEEVGGTARLTGVHNDLELETATADVVARSAYGRIRLGRVVRGEVTLTSTHGRLEVGVDPASAVWLDVDTRGRVRNALEPRPGPEGFAESVTVTARSQDGDVVVRRSITTS
ncbi:hypothetical protein Acsp06_06430 [Actinomycetospora sp. NBRC 106375]|uniref:DUF4097 family beta strand repeat-containing protein n=1 Tax=Actinomycetospora sp. NBRC 106375 TaxID=3032207 RepID=UPI0024A40655|nr:DUF4097 family beta strand repeat-containing protein [Actinomycetospora sp. NBRC 106375]GLZ44458.1 hypothetical protein Acsp06_06430 [Actinomycetospora sp. NBRC 106375]